MPFNPDTTVWNMVSARASSVLGKLRTLRSDEQGTISILSVIALLMLTMLLGMILNVGEQIDEKIQLQNAADASSYSSGVVLARGMNTVAFTNHLLSETFALTAYFREGRDRYAESLVPEILQAWEKVDQQLALSQFQLIREIQPAILPKMELEQEMVTAFGEMTAVKARLLLPALHTILGISELPGSGPATPDQQQQIALSHLIPTFQRAVVLVIPASATEIAREVSRRNTPERDGRTSQAVIWTTWTVPIQTIDQTNPKQRMLPGLDPSFEGPDYPYLESSEVGRYQQQARSRRDQLARHYLREWIDDNGFDMDPFEREEYPAGGRVSAKMSQFINLWRGFTCAKLNQLLDVEYPTTNLPHVLRFSSGETQQQYLENQFTFDTAVYRRQRTPTMPGMYRQPISGDNVAFARVSVYIPRVRYLTAPGCPYFYCPRVDWFGTETCVSPCTDRWPHEWSLFNQHWAAKMIPTSPVGTYGLMQTNPQLAAPGVTLPKMNSVQVQDLKVINFH